MELENLILGIFIAIVSLTILVSVSSLGLIDNLPLDLQVGWGSVVIMGIILSITSIAKEIGIMEKRVIGEW